HVVSLLDSPHNLHAYDEAGIAYVHVPLGPHDELAPRLTAIYSTLAKLLDDADEKLYMHHEEFGDRLLGVLAGYLHYAGFGDSDALEDTVDYGAVSEAVSRVIASERYRLLERLAARIAEVCGSDPRVIGVVVEVRKLQPPVRAMLQHVGVRIER